MLTAIARRPDGRITMVIGLTFGDLAKLKANAGKGLMHCPGEPVAMPVDIGFFAAENNDALQELLEPAMTAETVIIDATNIRKQ